MYKKQDESKEVPLYGILAEFRDALNDEINKIKSSGTSSIILRSGCPLESNGKGYWYRFLVEYAPALPADTPCKLRISNNQYNVSVVSVGDNAIIVASDISLPDNIGYAQLENGSTVLMERLIKCIEENAEKSNPAGNHMLTPDGSVYHAEKIFSYNDLQLKTSNTESQSRAVQEALSNDITYIWGPPGTGKTTVIGQIIDELYKHDRSVLVVSHTNTAVDGAIDKADESYSDSHAEEPEGELYPILRLGIPARTITNRALLDSHIKELGKDLYEQKQELENEQKSTQSTINKLSILIGKSKWVESSRLDEVGGIIDDLNESEKTYEEYNNNVFDLKQKIEAEKEANPNAAYYHLLCEQRDNLQKELDSLSEKIDSINEQISDKKNSIRAAEDEIRKCDRYAEMRAFRDKEFMSEEFYREQIESLDKEAEEKKSNIGVLNEEIDGLKNQITAYEQKTSFGRLFASSTTYSSNKARVEELYEQIANLEDEVRRVEKVASEERDKLENLLQLEKGMLLYLPSNDKQTWERLLGKYKSELSKLSDELGSLREDETKAAKTIESLLPHIEEAREAYEKISELQHRYDEYDAQLRELKKVRRHLSDSAKSILNDEIAFCARFFAISSSLLDSDIETMYKELDTMRNKAAEDVEGVDVGDAIKQKNDLNSKLNEIASKLADINSKLSDLERQAIMNAKIVGTTLAKSYLDSTLRERTFDTVILDEASMASIPALWCASYLAGNNIVIVGDFLQLPPIVMAETDMAKKWLGKDIFYLSGMQELAKKKSTCPSNFVMLNDQFRMESDIADIANMYYGQYGGLRSNDNTESRNKKREEFQKWYGKQTEDHVHLIDTESLNAWASAIPQGKSKSRLNSFSATVDIDMAFGFVENILEKIDPTNPETFSDPKVLIVAQYKAHIKLINQLIELGYTSRGFKENLGLIRAGTIHSFQGTEAEIVIFDLVVDDPHFSSNLSIPDSKMDDKDGLRKLFNVAITRAKFELFIVGDFKFLQKHAKNNALSELLDNLIDKKQLPKIDAKELLPNLVFTRPTSAHFQGDINNCQIICKETDYLEYLKKDLSSFKKRMIIYSPFMTERRLADLLSYFADAIKLGKTIVVVTKDRSDRGKKELASYIKCEEELSALGVNVIHKKGMHEKLVFVDSIAVWVGSLNTLSFTGETGEIMHRIGDKNITGEYEKIYDIAHIDNAVENKYELKCPICGGEMLVKESDDGGIYWGCENGDYTRSKDKPYPIDGVFRCHCGEPYVFAMKKQPRWVCPNKSCGGYMPIREGHLKFERMAALIPKGSKKEVMAYFAEQKREKEKAEKEKEKKSTKNKSTKKSTKKSSKQNSKKNEASKAKKKEDKHNQNNAEQMTLFELK